MRIAPDLTLIRRSLHLRCPRCDQGALYKSGLLPDLLERCPVCGLDYTRNDSADGPAVFLIFILGFVLVPMALAFEFMLAPPLWMHVILWPTLTVGLTIGSLKPLKSYIIALQFKHRPEDWGPDLDRP